MIVAIVAFMCYVAPVAVPIDDHFRAPACDYCPGNRGLEYQPPLGTSVLAAAPGVVAFVGSVAGTRYLVVDQGDGLKATYGRLLSVTVRTGQSIRPGQLVARSTDRLYFGLRQDGRYIDPAPFIGQLRFRPRLLPNDGSLGRPDPAPVSTCKAGGSATPAR